MIATLKDRIRSAYETSAGEDAWNCRDRISKGLGSMYVADLLSEKEYDELLKFSTECLWKYNKC